MSPQFVIWGDVLMKSKTEGGCRVRVQCCVSGRVDVDCRSMKKKLKKSAPARDGIRTDLSLASRKKPASKRLNTY